MHPYLYDILNATKFIIFVVGIYCVLYFCNGLLTSMKFYRVSQRALWVKQKPLIRFLPALWRRVDPRDLPFERFDENYTGKEYVSRPKASHE